MLENVMRKKYMQNTTHTHIWLSLTKCYGEPGYIPIFMSGSKELRRVIVSIDEVVENFLL